MNIAILGFGVEGQSAYSYYHAKYPNAQFTIYDNNSEPKNPIPLGAQFVGGVKNFKDITADVAVKTPAIPPWNVEVSGEVTTITREFLKKCPAPVIGVTGTKGKGTTSSLIKSILDAAGKKTWLVGNIGIGALDVLNQVSPNDIVIYELSSFQLWDIDVSPHVAVVLGIEPEHLDVHKDFDDYVTAKSHIAEYQNASDIVIYNHTNTHSVQIAQKSAGAHIPYLHELGAYMMDDYFFFDKQKLCKTDVLQIPGNHNKENACAAIAAAWPWVKDASLIQKGLASFEGLPFHIELIRESDGIKYYNDSFSTAPAATHVALQSMSCPVVLIAGGYDRGYNYEEMAKVIKDQQNIKKTLLIGQTGPRIAEFLPQESYEIIDDFQDTIRRAQEIAIEGDAILLSPGFASFDMFPNFTARGQVFNELVEKL
jgi:UDP-N-acetylmuramoylalanine--D-glutamate ligase